MYSSRRSKQHGGESDSARCITVREVFLRTDYNLSLLKALNIAILTRKFTNQDQFLLHFIQNTVPVLGRNRSNLEGEFKET